MSKIGESTGTQILNNYDSITSERTKKSKESEAENRLKGFLSVLTEQMRHQDPTSPMEAGDFSQLMSSFVMTQESARTNELLGAMLNLQKASSTSLTNEIDSHLGVIGHHVKCLCDTAIANKDGANFTFELNENSSNTEIIIKDAASDVEVHRENIGIVESGRNKYVFRNHGDLEIGKEYKIEIIARDESNNLMSVNYEIEDVVSSINKSENNGIYAILSDGMAVNSGQITSVSS